MSMCPRCRQQSRTLLHPQPDITLCPACWDLLLVIAAGDASDVDAR